MEDERILAFIRLLLEAGLPSVIYAIKQFDLNDDPTPDEIRALSDKLKDPAYYWKKRDVD